MTREVKPGVEGAETGFGALIRGHRRARGWSQEELALRAEVSTRHMSCLETGRSLPSREMVLLLARTLGIDLGARNELLFRAGFAAAFRKTPLDDRAMAPIHRAVDLILAQQEPFPALLLDRTWNLLRANQAAARLFATFLGAPLTPDAPLNLVRALFDPAGMRQYIVNGEEVDAAVRERLARIQAAHPGDERLRALVDDVRGTGPCCNGPAVSRDAAARKFAGVRERTGPVTDGAPVAVLHLRKGATELKLFTVLTTIGTPLDVTAEDLTIESFFPADDATDRWFRGQIPP